MSKPTYFCATCDAPPHASVHRVGDKHFSHPYESHRKIADRRARARAPLLCKPCASGLHNGAHTEIGCVEIVAPDPMSYVCKCALCAAHREPTRISGRRSDAEGVTLCRW